MTWHPSDRLFRTALDTPIGGQNASGDSSDQSEDSFLGTGAESTGSMAQDAAMGLPSSCSYCGATDFTDPTDNGRAAQATCAVCGGTMSSVGGGQWTPELIGDPSNHPKPYADPSSGGVGGAAAASDSLIRDPSRRGSLRVAALSWDDIGDRHPHIYGDSEIHGEAADGADGPGIGDAANYLAHERAEDPDAEHHSVHELDFHEQTVHPRHIDFSPSGVNDDRVTRAREGYKRHPEKMPPLVLVHRHGVYQVADGHHRAEAARGLNMPVKAYVAHSPYPDEPFRDGDKAPFYDAEPTEGHRQTAAIDGPDWCTHRQASHCWYPSTPMSEPQDRGLCPWDTTWQQAICPISDPGPLAVIRAKGAIEHMASDEDWKLQHQAPGGDEDDVSAPLHNVEHGGLMPDYYSHPEYYSPGQDYDYESHSVIRRAQGNPEKKVRIYRSLPAEHAHKGINQGDWVSTSKSYARDHGRMNDSKHDWPVISATVPAKHLHTEGDIHEWGYSGPSKGGMVSFKGGHHQEVSQRADGSIKPVQRREKKADPLQGFDIQHHESDINTDTHQQHVNAYDPEGNYAGHLNASGQGEVREMHVEPQHAHLPLEQAMVKKLHKREASLRDLAKVAQNDPEFAFHFTAAWSDVRAKATRIRREGGVRITVASNDGVAGEVKGDHNVYESALTFIPGSRKIGTWNCGCRWAAFAWGRSPAYKRFEGRMCSHALAMQFEAQARGMFGKEMQPDEKRPDWLKAHSPVVIQNDRDTNRNRTRRAVPPGNMRRTFESALQPPVNGEIFAQNVLEEYYRLIDEHRPVKGAYEPQGAIDPLEIQRAYDKAADEEREKHQDDNKYAENYNPLKQSDLHPDEHAAWGFKHNTNETPNPMRDMIAEHNPGFDKGFAVGQHEAPVNLTHYKHPIAMEPLHLDEHGGSWRRHYEWTHPEARMPEFRGWSGPHSASETLAEHPTWSQSHDAEGNRVHHMRTHREREQKAGVLPGETYHEITLRRNKALSESGWNVVSTLRPVTALVKAELAADEDPPALIKILQLYGLTHAAAKQVLDEALGRTAAEAKCPHCGGYIGPEALKHHRCPHCGHPLAGKEAAAVQEVDEDAEERKKKHKHDTNDTRRHAPEYGYGVPGWGLPMMWCGQCEGSGCGHCGGTGQVVDSSSTPSPNNTADPVPDQNSDAGEMMQQGISSTSKSKRPDAPFVSGVALKAADTGRVLMIQRSNKDEKDPAKGTWEFPGGHHEDGDTTSLHAGIREWQEEVGQQFPDSGVVHHTWTSPNGVYQGHVVVVPSEEDALTTKDGRAIANPDDPGGDDHEHVAWWEVEHARKNPALRQELKKDTPWGQIAKAGEQKTASAWERPGDEIQHLHPSSLLPFTDEHDPHRQRRIDQLAESMRQHGYDGDRGQKYMEREHQSYHVDENPVTLWHTDEHSFIEPGNHRVPAAAAAGLESIPVLVKDRRTKTASAWDSLESLNPPPGRGVEEPEHSNSENPASTGFLTAQDPQSWQEIGDQPSTLAPANSIDASLHDSLSMLHEEPEGALPSTDGADEDEWTPGASQYEVPDTHSSIDQTDASTTPDSFHMGSSVAEIVARFQATAGAKTLQSNGPAPKGDDMSFDIAAAARAHLAAKGGEGGDVDDDDPRKGSGSKKVALKDFSYPEQQELINEGARDGARARNFGELKIEGTHYEALQQALAQQGDGADDEDLLI